MTFTRALGWVSTRLLLTIFYFIILALPAIILRIIRKDLIHRTFEKQDSYWIKKPKINHTIEQAKHQF